MSTVPLKLDKLLKEYFDSHIGTGKLPPELQQLQGYQLFEDKELLKRWRNVFKGLQWTDEEGNILRGALDNVLVKQEKLVVLDFKTRGYAPKEETIELYRLQLSIYAFLLQQNGFEIEDYGYLLFYIPKEVQSGQVLFDSTLVKVDINLEDVEKIFNEAVSVLENELPISIENCLFCKKTLRK